MVDVIFARATIAKIARGLSVTAETAAEALVANTASPDERLRCSTARAFPDMKESGGIPWRGNL
jgi:hypothetical protein